MAIYHIRLGRVKRREGRSTVAAAAFQADERLLATATGIIHHPPPRPGLVDKRIVAPTDVAADWLLDRETLWNRAEAADKRANACVAYIIDFALPIELSDDQNIALGADFAQAIADYTKAVCDLALRWMSPENIAGVILLSSREVGLEGFGEKMRLSMTTPRRKSLGYTPHPISDLTDIREMLARTTNEHLERAGINARVDHRSLKDRGIDLIPQTHLGPVASRRIKNGEAMDHAASSTERSVHNAIRFFQEPDLTKRLLDDAGDRLNEASLTKIAKRYVSHPELQTGTIAFVSDVLLLRLEPDVAREQHQPLLDQLMAFNAETETTV